MSYTSEALRREGKVIVQDDDYEKFTRLGPHEAHYQDRLIGVAKLAPEKLYHPVHDFMDTLSREQEVLVKYWSPCLESDSEAKVWKNAPVPEGTPYGTRCVSLGCSSMIIHLEVHDEPLVSFIVSSRCVRNTNGV